MGAKTNLSKEDLKNILSEYDCGEYKGFQNFAQGAAQTTLLLITTKGKFVLKYYENRSEKWILFEINLFNYLKSKNYPIPRIIKNLKGKFFGKHKNKSYVIIEYLDGKHTKNPNESFSRKESVRVAEIIAKLHNLTLNYNPFYFKYRPENTPEHCWKNYFKFSERRRNSEREDWLKAELDKLILPKTLPRGLCHADVNHGNFLFKKDRIVAVLDFDMSFRTFCVYDVANLIYWWAWPPNKGFILERAKYIVKRYSKFRNLNNLEKKYIYDSLKLIILLGISWSKDDEFESERGKINFLNSLGRENFYKKLFE